MIFRDGALQTNDLWQLDDCPSPDWAELVAKTNATFFHSPIAPSVTLPPGKLVFAKRIEKERVTAVAVGIASGCRLSRGLRHFHFASLPAVVNGIDKAGAAAELAGALRNRGAAVVSFDSFDSLVCAAEVNGGQAARLRFEHIVTLTPAAELTRHLSSTHRRHVNRGNREQWQLRTLTGEAANQLLNEVQGNAAQRNGFTTAAMPAAVAQLTADNGRAWGIRCFAAFDRDTPLAAVLVGWAGKRAFYIVGGSTPAGYQAGAATWLQHQIMNRLYTHGISTYNLGGTPAGAEETSHPEHGLFRFKKGFGSDVVVCRGLRWELRPNHLRLHRVLAAVGRKA